MERINLDDLADAFEDASPVMPYFLDRETGELLLVADALGFIDAERQRLAMAEEPGRFVPIPPLSSVWREETMEAFLDEVEDDALAEKLEAALDKSDPVRAWNVIIGGDDDWKRFFRMKTRKCAEDWLREVGRTGWSGS